MSNDRLLSMISLAKKAGRLVSGEFAVDNAGKSGEAQLVIVAEDASERTKKSVTDMCRFYEVPCILYGTKDSLGRAIGKENRSQIAITDSNFANGIRKLAGGTEQAEDHKEAQGDS